MIGLELQTKGLNLRFQVFFLINIFYNDMIDHHRRGCIFHQPIFVSRDMVGYAMETYAYASTFNSMIMFLHLRLRYDIYLRQIDKIINLKYE